MQSIEYRYTNDPMVKALVDTMVSAIVNLQMTPSEIRECAMLAAIRYEQSRPAPVNLGSVSELPTTQVKTPAEKEPTPDGEICPKCNTDKVLYSCNLKLFYCQECCHEWSGKLLLT